MEFTGNLYVVYDGSVVCRAAPLAEADFRRLAMPDQPVIGVPRYWCEIDGAVEAWPQPRADLTMHWIDDKDWVFSHGA